MGRFWSVFFLSVPIFGVLIFVWPMADLWPLQGYWLPENINDYGGIIDQLFLFILYLTGIIFVGTTVVLFWFLWKYDAQNNPNPVKYSHGSHALEVVWSILPAATLLFIAIYQMNAWADHKLRRPKIEVEGHQVPKPALAEVTARQFEWRIRYPGTDGLMFTADDVHTVNDLHVPVNEDVVLAIKSQDVLHSFFLPQLRVKQDIVPGMKQYVWFKANKLAVHDIVCAELCGWGHYKMRGRITIESRESFEKWLNNEYAAQERSEFTPKTGTENE